MEKKKQGNTYLYVPLEVKLFNATGTFKNEQRDNLLDLFKKFKHKFGYKNIKFVNSEKLRIAINKKLNFKGSENKFRANIFDYFKNTVILELELIDKKFKNLHEIKNEFTLFLEFIFGYIFFVSNKTKKTMFELNASNNYTFYNTYSIEKMFYTFFIIEDEELLNFRSSDLIELNSSLKTSHFSDKRKYFDLDKHLRDINLGWIFNLYYKLKKRDKKQLLELYSLYFKASFNRSFGDSFFKYWVIIEKIFKSRYGKLKDKNLQHKIHHIVIDDNYNSKIKAIYNLRNGLVHEYKINNITLEIKENLKIICYLVMDFYYKRYLEFNTHNFFLYYTKTTSRVRNRIQNWIVKYNLITKNGLKDSQMANLLLKYLKKEINGFQIKKFLNQF